MTVATAKQARLIDLVNQHETLAATIRASVSEKADIEIELTQLLDHPQDQTRNYEIGDKTLTISKNVTKVWVQDDIKSWAKETPEILNYFNIEYAPKTDLIATAIKEARDIAQNLVACQNKKIGKPSFAVSLRKKASAK